MNPGGSTSSGSTPSRDNYDVDDKRHRDNRQMVSYAIVVCGMLICYVIGYFNFSASYLVLTAGVVFSVWKTRCIAIVEEALHRDRRRLYNQRALASDETAEWLNLLINRWWVFSGDEINTTIKNSLDPILSEVKPSFLDSIELSNFTLGSQTPYIRNVISYEYASPAQYSEHSRSSSEYDSDSIHQRRLIKAKANAPLSLPLYHLKKCQKYDVIIVTDTVLHCDEFKMEFIARLGGKWLGKNISIAIEKLNISGKLQLSINFDKDKSFPHVNKLSITFLEKPEVWFSVQMVKSLQMMEIPLLKNWIHSLVIDGLTQALVDPGKIDIKLNNTDKPPKSSKSTNASYVLMVTVGEQDPKSSMFIDDIRYCTVAMGDQKTYTPNTQGHTPWSYQCSFLVYDLVSDKVTIRCKSKILLTTYTLASFDINLKDHPFKFNSNVKLNLEEKIRKHKGGGTLKLSVGLELVGISQIEDILTSPMCPTHDDVSGVMYVCIHGANNLLGMNRSGSSDPYCILYCSGKKIKTTHYICENKNPIWNSTAEFIVTDYREAMLAFIIYDWDGEQTDNFLGSAYFTLSKEELLINRRTLPLRYDIINEDGDTSKLGTITITIAFRPVSCIRLKGKELSSTSKKRTNTLHNSKLDHFKEHMSSSHCDLSFGRDLLEVNVLQAKNLMAKDSNGFSDPFLVISINKERKFTTSVCKKTLNPRWDEWVTLQLPDVDDKFDISLWDKDKFFQKDFLGSLEFTVKEIKYFSKQKTQNGWFKLNKAKSGYVQIKFNVLSDNESFCHSPVKISPDEGVSNHSAVVKATEPNPTRTPVTPPLQPPPLSRKITAVDSISEASASLSCDTAATHDSHQEDHYKDRSTRTTHTTSDDCSSEGGQLHLYSETDSAVMTDSVDSIAGQPTRHVSGCSRDRRSQLISCESSPSKISRSMSLNNKSSEYTKNILEDALPSNNELLKKDFYYGVHGRIGRITGVTTNCYCKLKIDSNPKCMKKRQHKIKTLIKSRICTNIRNDFDMDFEIDCAGNCISFKALLIFDIRNSSHECIVSQGFALEDIFSGNKLVTKYLALTEDIEIEVNITYNGILARRAPSSKSKHLLKGLKNRLSLNRK